MALSIEPHEHEISCTENFGKWPKAARKTELTRADCKMPKSDAQSALQASPGSAFPKGGLFRGRKEAVSHNMGWSVWPICLANRKPGLEGSCHARQLPVQYRARCTTLGAGETGGR